MNKVPPPESEAILQDRAKNLAGLTILQIATFLNTQVPVTLLKAKGFMGEIVEAALGADAGNKKQPDFTKLGIELKSLPIDRQGKPLESTYVTTLPLTIGHHTSWGQSEVYLKLKRVLWVPIISEPDITIENRMIANPFIWSPTQEDMSILQNDWQEIMDMVLMGQVEKLTGRFGTYLHVRPKAANARSLTDAYDSEGNLVQTLPRGFYLRSQFTQKVLQEVFA